MKFSTDNQPAERTRKMCRKGIHDMTDDSNVFIKKSNGERRCRACASETLRTRRQNKAEADAIVNNGIPRPFTLNNLYYEPEIYEHTPLSTLIEFGNFQKKYLQMAQTTSMSGWNMKDPEGDPYVLRKEIVIEVLTEQIPITTQWVTKKIVAAREAEYAEEAQRAEVKAEVGVTDEQS